MNELERFVRRGRRVLLLTSYCGEDNADCMDDFPCDECLKMCNVVEIDPDRAEVMGGFEYLKEQTPETSGLSRKRSNYD